MGYYMGDFYGRGGRMRYMGDPGFFSFLGGLAKSALGMVPGVGPIAQKVISVGQSVMRKSPALQKIVSTAAGHPALTAAGTAATASAVAGAALALHHRGSMAAAGMGAPGARAQGGRRHRRMNACNPKALRRAIRRTHSFAKLAMKTIHLVHPKKHVLFGGFKKRRKK